MLQGLEAMVECCIKSDKDLLWQRSNSNPQYSCLYTQSIAKNASKNKTSNGVGIVTLCEMN